MKQENNSKKKQGGRKKVQLYKPRKKKSVEEDAAIPFLQARYEKIVSNEIKTFKDLPLSQKTLKGLKENNFITPTEIQKQAIGLALQGKDILGAAKTGSGKTLAFLIPILEKLFCKKWTRLDGVGAMVISPTRELAYQIYETLRKVGQYHDFSAGLIIGGQNLNFERKRMDQINILIGTPGRLLQHMDENPLFNSNQLEILVLDEADRCLDMGFEATMNAIIENLPPERQTLLFSATQTKSVKDLARLSLSFPTYVAPHEQADTVTPDALQQSYIVCEVDEKIGILWSFIKNHLKQKVIVFMATCKQVKYTYELFCKLRPGVSLLALYGTLHQEKREKIYNEFCRKSNVVLFATDLASRGLDFPLVNWVIQMDCPEDVDTYIHRAGRTARGVFGKGEGLLMLLPHEEKIVEDLMKRKIPINKISVDPSKIVAPNNKIQTVLSEFPFLKQSAQRAFVSYVKSIYVMKNKEIFNVEFLDTDAFARSLGLIVPPVIKFMHRNIKKCNLTKDSNGNGDDVLNKVKVKDNDDSGSNLGEEEDECESDTKIDKISKKDIKQLKLEFNNKIEKRSKKKNEPIKLSFVGLNDDCSEDPIIDFKSGNSQKCKTAPDNDTKKKKPLTKAALAKQILKSNKKFNTSVKFTEESEAIGEVKLDAMSNVTEEYESGTFLDFENAKGLINKEDKLDQVKFRENVRAKHKEQKRKQKNKSKDEEEEKDDFGSQSESDGPDLTWLPDPDKVYGKGDNSDDVDDNLSDEGNNRNNNRLASDGSECENDDDIYHKPRASKRQLTTRKKTSHGTVVPHKKKRLEDISALLSMQEAEALAMQLLQAKR